MMDEPTRRTGLPAWLRNGLIAVGMLVFVVVAIMFATGGDHGPGRHGARPLDPSLLTRV